MQLPRTKARNHGQRDSANEVELESDNREVDGNEESERDFADGIEGFGEQTAFLVYDGKAGQECGEDQAHVKGSSDDAVSQQNRQRIGDRRVLREHVEARLVDALDDSRE